MYPPANDGGTNLGSDSVTTRYPHYTLWQFKEFSYLSQNKPFYLSKELVIFD